MTDPVPTTAWQPESKRLVLVIGPGRSGTSTIAGALVKSGMEVPGRAVRANLTNPSGFFEPRWVVDFHKQLLRRAGVGTLDSSPMARDRVREMLESSRASSRLGNWLTARLEEQPHLVVKDPRLAWFRDLWVSAAQGAGVDPRFLTMLRHPAEVSASRETYYAKRERADRRAEDVRRISGWVNVALGAELDTRGSPRIFVKYTNLVADWRKELQRVGTDLDVTFDPPIEQAPHPVDDFIDASLHRVRVDWSDVSVPDAIKDVAQRTWEELGRLSDGGEAAGRPDKLDALREEYLDIYGDALALTRTELKYLQTEARRRGYREGRASAETSEAASSVGGGRDLLGSGRELLGSGRDLWRRLRRR